MNAIGPVQRNSGVLIVVNNYQERRHSSINTRIQIRVHTHAHEKHRNGRVYYRPARVVCMVVHMGGGNSKMIDFLAMSCSVQKVPKTVSCVMFDSKWQN